MAFTRADIRGFIRQQVDPSSATINDTDLNSMIGEAVQQVSSLLPIRFVSSTTPTGTAVTLSARLRFIESVKITNTYNDPLHQAHSGFTTDYYHPETLIDTTLFTFGQTLSGETVEIIYYAETSQTDNDAADFALPDQHAPVIILLVLAWANTSLFMLSTAVADDIAIISRLLSTADDAWDEYFIALATAVSEWERAADNVYQLA